MVGGGNYWAPLTRKRHTIPHPAQFRHTNYWAPRTRKRHPQEHRPPRPTERSDPTQHAKGRTGDCPGPRKETATRRNVTQGEQTRRFPDNHLQRRVCAMDKGGEQRRKGRKIGMPWSSSAHQCSVCPGHARTPFSVSGALHHVSCKHASVGVEAPYYPLFLFCITSAIKSHLPPNDRKAAAAWTAVLDHLGTRSARVSSPVASKE